MITDVDHLLRDQHFSIAPHAKRIRVIEPVVFNVLYGHFKELWMKDEDLIVKPFPFLTITPVRFELIHGWRFADDETRRCIKDAEWTEDGLTYISQGPGLAFQHQTEIEVAVQKERGWLQEVFDDVAFSERLRENAALLLKAAEDATANPSQINLHRLRMIARKIRGPDAQRSGEQV
ncbi:MAG: hypothetical protein AB7U75_14495 [Hyphomicrobiaceae bacterium]